MSIDARAFSDYAKQVSSDKMSEGSVPFEKNGGSLTIGMDCGGFIEYCLRHFNENHNYSGANDLFRHAGDELYSLDYATEFGLVIPGVLCFIANNDFSDTDPKYLNDGKLNADCVGICIGNHKVLWYSKNGRCFKIATLAEEPQYERDFWTHILLCRHIDYSEYREGAASGTSQRPTIKKGASGNDVVYLQMKLAENGWSIETDGSFGPNTHNAVIEFQQSKNLEADGIVGPKTWAALDA